VNARRSSSDLGSSAEATLSTFPFPERDWESDARAIELRLTDSTRGSTEAVLLAAPLPSEADEPSTTSATATPLTNSGVRTQSLAEIARRSVEKKQASERQIARETLALAAQQRQRLPHHDAPPAAASVGSVAGNGVAASGIARESATAAKTKPFPKVALVLPALALAAAAVIWSRQPAPAPLVTHVIAPAAPSAVAPSAAATNAVARNQPSSVEDAPRGVDPNTLPGEATLPKEQADGKSAPVNGNAPVAAAPAKASSSKTGPKGGGTEPKAVDDGLPPDPALRPADSRSGEIPAKPTTGAVQAALGSVMSGARHCVAGDEAPSSAVVVFGSDGRVQRVTVSGAAAGKSSASCIEAQLSRARVQPFAASSFSVNATVRPE
jgi:hypothetical protein